MASEITIVGNLTRDPDMKVTAAGDSLVTFTVASTPRTFDKRDMAWRDGEPLYMDCTVWKHMAENVMETLRKGARVIVTGKLRHNHWETDAGEKRSRMVLTVEDIGPSLQFATCTISKNTRSSESGATRAAGPGTTARPGEPPF